MNKRLKYGISLSIGRKNDLRFKLSEQDVASIKSRQTESASALARELGVCRQTIDYHRNEEVNRKMREKNAKHKRAWSSHDNVVKQRRRNLVRPKVREYTRIQMRAFRSA
jgi:hypothetical protein